MADKIERKEGELPVLSLWTLQRPYKTPGWLPQFFQTLPYFWKRENCPCSPCGLCRDHTKHQVDSHNSFKTLPYFWKRENCPCSPCGLCRDHTKHQVDSHNSFKTLPYFFSSSDKQSNSILILSNFTSWNLNVSLRILSIFSI